jgi:hypothetical protein
LATGDAPTLPVTVLPALPGKAPRPATGRAAVALARANGVASALARPYKAELGWTAQWQGHQWWLVGVYESDWGARFVVRAAVVGGHYVRFGAGPTRQWILDNARPQVTTLYTRFTPTAATAQMHAYLRALPAPQPGWFPDFNPANYEFLDGAADLVLDAPTSGRVTLFGPGPGWYFVYYARDLRTGQNVVVPVTGINYSLVSEGQIETAPGANAYGLWGEVADNVPPVFKVLHDWISSVIAARGWQPTNWPTTGYDPSFTIPPFLHRPMPVSVAKPLPGPKPSPATGRKAVAVARANLNVASVLAGPFAGELGWSAQWRGKEWWLVGAFKSAFGKRFVVRATVVGGWVKFGTGPGRGWIAKHVRPRWTKAFYARLKPSDATAVMKAEMLASPSQFDATKYSILDGAAKLAQDVQPSGGSGPAWYFVFYAKDLATGKKVVLPVTSGSLGPLVETTYETSTPGDTAYGFQGFEVLPKVPGGNAALSRWIRRVVAEQRWDPTNLR